jgi:hypothetical protein
MSSDPMLGHPASQRRGWPTAPAPLSVVVAVDAWLLVTAGALVLADATWWWYIAPLAVGVVAMWISGRKTAKAQGIRTVDETPRGSLIALGSLGGLLGVTAENTGRYAGLVFALLVLAIQVGERIAWARFRTQR